ncbi:MAG: hypothetical protein IPL26_22250 [Leptospiraceae bacterium]|nr:hypothetical protein [Leptospiraceae bacterium]
MIKKSIITFAILFFIWSRFLSWKQVSASQHQWQDNLILAELFLFDVKESSKLIVGSSLSGRLAMGVLWDFHNLSFGGLSIFDGLNLVRAKKNLPKNIFIEINVIDRNENESFKEAVSSPVINVLKKKFRALRTDKQPLALLGNFTFKETNIASVDQDLFNMLLERQKENYRVINKTLINKHLTLLFEHVTFLNNNGVNVVFFEMPVNKELVQLEKAVYFRSKIIETFPNNRFIPMPENLDSYKTNDGIHLNPEEAMLYSNYFRNETIKMFNTGK